MECRNPGSHGCVRRHLAGLDAGCPCRHDGCGAVITGEFVSRSSTGEPRFPSAVWGKPCLYAITSTLRRSISLRRFFEPADGIDVGSGSREACFHRVDGQMSRPEFFPLGDLLDPRLGQSLANRKPSFNADAHGITSGFPGVRLNLCDRGLARFVRPQLRKPAVAEPSQTAQCSIVSASEPDWNGLLNR